MGFDPRQYAGFIVIAAGAIVLGLSYLAAYMIGRDHGRRQRERMSQESGQLDATHRISAVESSLKGLSHSVERIMDAQRLLVAQQDHLSRKVGGVDRNLGFGARKGHTNTPA